MIGGVRLKPSLFEKMAIEQQVKLQASVIEWNGEDNGRDTVPNMGSIDDQLAPGAAPLKFRYETDANGTEWQVEIATGQKWKV